LYRVLVDTSLDFIGKNRKITVVGEEVFATLDSGETELVISFDKYEVAPGYMGGVCTESDYFNANKKLRLIITILCLINNLISFIIKCFITKV